MTDEPLSYWDYVKAAFRYRPRLGWLGRMPFNQMALVAFGLLGLFNPGFWFLGAALEIGYLGFLSGNAVFQKYVQGERLLSKQVSWESRIVGAINRLSPESRERYRRLWVQCGQILGLTNNVEQDTLGALSDLRAGGLNQLLWLFLRLLISRETMAGNLSTVDPRSVEAEVARLRERLTRAEPESALARSLQGTLDIQLKRLENLTKGRSGLEVVEAELDRIEQQVHLILEESAVGGGPEGLSTRLDAVSSTLGETSRWMDQNAEIFGSFAVEDEMTGGGTVLPRLPEAEASAAPPPLPPRGRVKG
jgi:hypothetical protein